MKKIPQRTCIGCNSKKDKKDLIRVVKNKDGKICIDLTGKKMAEEYIFVNLKNVLIKL